MRLIPILVFILLSGCDVAQRESQNDPLRPTAPPNVVIILADDMGYGDIGVNGAELINTPNLGRVDKRLQP